MLIRNLQRATTTLGVLLIALVVIEYSKSVAHEAAGAAHERLVFTAPLTNHPDSRMTAVVVSYEPGGKSPPHRHAGSVFAYVLSGSIRSQNSATGPSRVYHEGESFNEPEGSVHAISENASATEPASLLAVFVAPDGAQLTTKSE